MQGPENEQYLRGRQERQRHSSIRKILYSGNVLIRRQEPVPDSEKLSSRIVTQGVDPEHLRQAMTATKIDSAAAAATNGPPAAAVAAAPEEEEKKEREAPVHFQVSTLYLMYRQT